MATRRKKRRRYKLRPLGIFLLSLVIIIPLVLISALVLKNRGIEQNPSTFSNSDSYNSSSDSSSDSNSESKTATTSPDEIVVKSTATIGNIGDIILHSTILTSYYEKSTDSYDFDNMFEHSKSTFEGVDFMVANLEVTLGGNNQAYSGYPAFNAPDSIVDAAKYGGIDMLLTANNHAYDTGLAGFLRTPEVLTQKGIIHTGTRVTTTEKPYVVNDVNGIKIGMINYTYETPRDDDRKALNGALISEEAEPLVNSFDYDDLDSFYNELETNIASMKTDGAEAIVVYMHWGNEYLTTVDSHQRIIAQKLCDLGVDVIIGGHPHVVEPMELFTSSEHKTICVYSLGNAVSNQRKALMDLKTGETEDGLMFNYTFTKYSDGKVELTSFSALPLWMNMYTYSGKKYYKIVPIEDPNNLTGKFDLDKTSTGVADAAASYKRTMNIIGSSITKLESVYKNDSEKK